MILLFLLGACGSDDGGAAPAPDAAVDSCAASKFAGPSEPCCLDNGADACGGGLFCAAFDGRDQAVCYPEYSRPDLSECTEDRQCVSQSCNLDEGKCRSIAAAVCDQSVGCAPVGDVRFVCDVDASMCLPVGNGAPGSLCENDGDCDARSPACDPVTHHCDRWPITAEPIDTFAATDISLSFHESGRPFVSMNNPGGDTVQLALRQESEWRRSSYPRDASGPAALPGPGDETYLCMAGKRDASSPADLVFEVASDVVSTFQVEADVEVGSQYATSMAQAADGTLHISYRDGGRLLHAFGAPDTFFDGEITEVDINLGFEGYRTSLAMHDDRPAIAYNSATEVRLARFSTFSDSWITQTVRPGRSPSLAFDGNGVPHLSFFDPEDASIRHATQDDLGDWIVEEIVDQGAAERSNLAVDASGVVHVLFHLAGSRTLMYARRDGAGWVTGRVDTGGPVGPDSALAVDAAGLVHLVFVDETSSEIRYATITRP